MPTGDSPLHTPLTLAAVLSLLAGASAQAQDHAYFDWFEYSGHDPVHDSVDLQPGQFLNPVLSGFYPDPSNTRVGEDYYLVTSSFAYFPGLPIFHSQDLVNWRLIGHAIDRPDQVDFGNLGLSRGLFAPAIEHHDGRYYITNTCVDCGGNFVITADAPEGPWSDPEWLPDLEGGIDPSLFFDEDGSAYILNNGPPDRSPEYDGHRAVWIQRFDTETLSTFGPRTVLIDGGVNFEEQPIWIEGPHIYKVDDWYYLTAAEGGTAVNHSQVVLKSRSPEGPYTAFEGNPILTQRDLPNDRPFPITSAGHADLVQTPDGDWWATFLAVRPYEGDLYNTGRETFLLPVDWTSGWPVITRPGEVIDYTLARPVLPEAETDLQPMTGPFNIRDGFDGDTLSGDWLMWRNPQSDWYTLNDGALELELRDVSLSDFSNPSFLGRRQQHIYGEASTLVHLDGPGQAGLAAVQNDEYWYTLTVVVDERDGRSVEVRRRNGAASPQAGALLASLPLDADTSSGVRLRVVMRGQQIDFHAAMAQDGWVEILTGADARLLSTSVARGFVGVTIGPYAHADRN